VLNQCTLCINEVILKDISLYIRNVINCREYLYVGIYIIKCVFNQYTLYINEVTLKDIYYYIGIIIDSRE
jgi:hypothetical protein